MRITRNSRVYRWLLTLNKRQRFLFTLSIILCMVAGWFFFLYQPTSTRMQVCQNKMIASETNNELCHSLHRQGEKLEQTVNTLQQNLLTNKTVNKKNKDYLTTVAQLAQQSTVCIDSCTLEPFEEKQNFTVLPLAIQGHSTIAQLADFLNKIFNTYATASPAQITIEHMKNNVFQFNFHLTITKAS